MKPVELTERALRNASKWRDAILDPFGGSGSTMIACEKMGRQARLIELDRKCSDVIGFGSRLRTRSGASNDQAGPLMMWRRDRAGSPGEPVGMKDVRSRSLHQSTVTPFLGHNSAKP